MTRMVAPRLQPVVFSIQPEVSASPESIQAVYLSLGLWDPSTIPLSFLYSLLSLFPYTFHLGPSPLGLLSLLAAGPLLPYG